MKYLIKCCGRIVDVDNKPKWCIKCGIHNVEVEEFDENTKLPCPFCGGQPQAQAMDSVGLYWYECDTCEASSGGAEDWAEATRKWNKRI